jgi:hypothetical protein
MAALAVIVFWGGLLMAARLYPSEYDWRYITVSILLLQTATRRAVAGRLAESRWVLSAGWVGPLA